MIVYIAGNISNFDHVKIFRQMQTFGFVEFFLVSVVKSFVRDKFLVNYLEPSY